MLFIKVMGVIYTISYFPQEINSGTLHGQFQNYIYCLLKSIWFPILIEWSLGFNKSKYRKSPLERKEKKKDVKSSHFVSKSLYQEKTKTNLCFGKFPTELCTQRIYLSQTLEMYNQASSSASFALTHVTVRCNLVP